MQNRNPFDLEPKIREETNQIGAPCTFETNAILIKVCVSYSDINC